MSGLSIWFNPSKPNHYGQLPNTPVLNGPNLSSCADKRRSRENTMYTCSSLTGSYWLPETLHKRNYSCDSVASSNDFSNANSSDSEDFKSSWTHEAPTEHSKSDPPPFNANLHTPERDVSHVLKGSELHLDSPSDISYEGIPSNFNQIKKSDIPAVLDRDLRKSNLYKTEFCRSYEETGFCRYGSKCQFAHSTSELRVIDRHPKYKTVICKTFWEQGTCPYGKRCCFIHHARSSNGQPSKRDENPAIWQEFSFQPNSRIRRNSADMVAGPSSSIAEVSSKDCTGKRLPIFQHLG